MEQSRISRKFNKTDVWLSVSAGLFLMSVALYAAQRFSRSFADGFNRSVGSVCRLVLNRMTGWLPFSLAEVCILLLPAAVVVTVILVSRKCKSWRQVGRFALVLLSVLALLFDLFVLTYNAGYFGVSVDERMGLEKSDVSTEELYETVLLLIERTKAAATSVTFPASGSTNSPHTVSGLGALLSNGFAAVAEKYGIVDGYGGTFKPILASTPMLYTHITGIYTCFTGEANVNTAYPDYAVAYTAAHEMAHQRGIAREDEANFVAFLVLIHTDDAYLVYCGYQNLLEYCMNSLYEADSHLWRLAWDSLPEELRNETAAYSEFCKPFRDNPVGKVTTSVNNAYLTGQNAGGSRSYGLVTDLAVAYFKEN